MKKQIVLFILFVHSFLAQTQPCWVAPGGIPAQDELPGCMLCDSGYVGPIHGYTPGDVAPVFPCGDITGNQWLTIPANSEGRLKIRILINSCNTNIGRAEAMIYDLNLNPVSTCISTCEGSAGALNFDLNLTPSEHYLLMVDNCNVADSCDLFVKVQSYEIQPNLPPAADSIKVVPDRDVFCPEQTVHFSFDPIQGATDYYWTFSQDLTIISGGQRKDTFVNVQFPPGNSRGTKVLRVVPYVDCLPGEPFQYWAKIDELFGSSEIFICSGESHFVGSESFSETGNYTILLKNGSVFGCDSTVSLDLKVEDISVPVVNCLVDTFLNAIAINWTRKPFAENYEIYINDSLVTTQDYVGYLYYPQSSEETIDIKIQPIGSHGCDYAPGYLTCTAPNLSSSKEISEKELVSVFPNPSSGVFEVFFRENSHGATEKIERIEVFDFSGKEQKTVFESKFDLSKFESGIYFLKIHFDRRIAFKKIIKQ